MYILEIFNSKIPLLEHIKIIRFIRKTFLAILPRINCLKKNSGFNVRVQA